jgi:sec-independent protein translocase protein TatB
MFDIAPSEFLLVAFVALVVIGPKDLPKAMRVVGYWVGKARGVARSFRQGFDNMVREAELEEMEKRWAAENARIMAEHPVSSDAESVAAAEPVAAADPAGQAEPDAPVMVERPVVMPAPEHKPAPHPDTTPS